jgi:spore coat polysaccharide biosynthesis protein SpsF
MNGHVGIIVQARLASTRLPGKALAPLGSRTVLEHCLQRMIAGGVGRVVLATTERPEDDALEVIASRLGVAVFRGNTNDVLERYADAVARFGFDHIVRVTADNPAVDIQAPGRLLTALREHDADYVREVGLPYGADAEAITRDALNRAAAEARTAYDREHVTTYIRKHAEDFRIVQLAAPRPLMRPDLRFTIDTRGDLLYMRDLFLRTESAMPTVRELIEVAGRVRHAEVA